MTAVLLVLFAVVAGVSNPVQSGANSELLKHLHSVVVAAFTVYAFGSILLIASVPFLGFNLKGALGGYAGAPWWAYLGGLCNVIFLLASLTIAKKLGSAAFTTLVVISATLTSVALDQFGLMGFKERPASLLRLLGCGLAVAGVVLIGLF